MRGCAAMSWSGLRGFEMARPGASRAARLANVPVIDGRSCRAVRLSPKWGRTEAAGLGSSIGDFSCGRKVAGFGLGDVVHAERLRLAVGLSGSGGRDGRDCFLDRCSWVACPSRGGTASLSRGCSRRHRHSAAVRLQAGARTCDVSDHDRIRWGRQAAMG